MQKRLQALHAQFEKMEAKKQEIMNLLQSLTPEQYDQHPNPSTWSIGQVVNHLYLSERNSLAYLRKKLSFPDLVPGYSPKSWVGIGMIKLVYLFHIKIKAPESINMWKVDMAMPYAELKLKWDELRRELISFIEQHEPAFGSHLAFRHPFAGRMTMRQMLIFMNDHLHHHQNRSRKPLPNQALPQKLLSKFEDKKTSAIFFNKVVHIAAQINQGDYEGHTRIDHHRLSHQPILRNVL
jgi:uncharacterized damage-inducible protein DinB